LPVIGDHAGDDVARNVSFNGLPALKAGARKAGISTDTPV
jgi:hypothetical protein